MPLKPHILTNLCYHISRKCICYHMNMQALFMGLDIQYLYKSLGNADAWLVILDWFFFHQILRSLHWLFFTVSLVHETINNLSLSLTAYLWTFLSLLNKKLYLIVEAPCSVSCQTNIHPCIWQFYWLKLQATSISKI